MTGTQLLPPIHPGEMLRDELEARGLSMNQLARGLCVPMNRISAIVNGKRAITADTALRLARFFGTSAQMWMNLQTDYDLKVTAREAGPRIEREVRLSA
ncbi:MAG: HigA family addiction module antidote protein [Bryobacterales bacterium]|nr:HigA family addiction module antidote protein [Bryobacterales bacterium]